MVEQRAPLALRTIDVVVIGAGAAGTWCAWRCAELGLPEVVLLEKTPRVGTKILASGGSRCNLTTTLDGVGAAALFGIKGARFLKRAFGVLAPADVRERFGELGVATEVAPLEKIFPSSGSAKEVRDALERAARAAGVDIWLDGGVLSVAPVLLDAQALSPHDARSAEADAKPGRHGWRVTRKDGSVVLARRLVLASGGQSYASTGTTGDAYGWLRDLDLQLIEPKPALVPLLSPATWVHELKGIALQNASVRLIDARGKVVGERRRPLLFTHLGVSGPAAMDLSRLPAREGGAFFLRVDLVPDVSRETLRDGLIELAGRPRAPQVLTLCQEWLSALAGEILPKRLLEEVLRSAQIDPRESMQAVNKAARHVLIETLKGWDIPIEGDAGYDKAEVTSGGLHLKEVDPGTCRVRRLENLWVVGELLDLDGPIGGLNFQSAFATAELAARDLADRVTPT